MRLLRWIEDEWRERAAALAGVVLLAVALVALIIGLVWQRLGDADAVGPRVVVLAAPAAGAVTAATLPVVMAPVVPVRRAPPAPTIDCAHQQLEVTGPAGPQRGCVSATRTGQRGSLRTYRVDAEARSDWQLEVDAASERVVAIRLRRASAGATDAALFTCYGRACRGATLGPPDAHGARPLTLVGAQLKGKGTDADAAPVRLSAALQVAPDVQQALPACPDPGVTVVLGQGSSVQLFCPLGGAGFELDGSGPVRHVFRDLEGRLLVVALGVDQTVEGVSFGPFSCRGPACGGVATQAFGDAADPAVERRFSFSGTTLSASKEPGRSATLNGSLTMPSQQ